MTIARTASTFSFVSLLLLLVMASGACRSSESESAVAENALAPAGAACNGARTPWAALAACPLANVMTCGDNNPLANVNGCGPTTSRLGLVAAQLVAWYAVWPKVVPFGAPKALRVKNALESCCNSHDVGYGSCWNTPNADKNRVDMTLFVCHKSVCNQNYINPITRIPWRMWAKCMVGVTVIYDAVAGKIPGTRAKGIAAWQNGQELACYCPAPNPGAVAAVSEDAGASTALLPPNSGPSSSFAAIEGVEGADDPSTSLPPGTPPNNPWNYAAGYPDPGALASFPIEAPCPGDPSFSPSLLSDLAPLLFPAGQAWVNTDYAFTDEDGDHSGTYIEVSANGLTMACPVDDQDDSDADATADCVTLLLSASSNLQTCDSAVP